MLVIDPDKQLLGRLDFNATPEETIDFLQELLARRPELAPDEDPLARLDRDLEPPQLELRELQARFDAEERETLVQPLERWLDEFGQHYWDDAAVALTLLGSARYHAGDYDGAEAAWRDVWDNHPNHPIRHRAWYNLLDHEGSLAVHAMSGSRSASRSLRFPPARFRWAAPDSSASNRCAASP
jgi:tetratricopeptide (TPR) repeat protein